MPSLFGQQLPGAQVQAGTPGYENMIMQRTQNQLRPQYKQALTRARQGLANRGILGSPESTNVLEGGIGQEYRSRLADTALGSATASADLAEQNRRRVEERGWQSSDIAQAMAERRAERDAASESANQAMWSNALGSASKSLMALLGQMSSGKKTDDKGNSGSSGGY